MLSYRDDMATALLDTWQLWLPAQDQAKKTSWHPHKQALTGLNALKKEEDVRAGRGCVGVALERVRKEIRGGYDQGTLYTHETVNKYNE